ncbi:chemotaxis protein CheA [Bdellovibrio sp. SKB1291214]|uniref:chemotaxis protein CheA n=1 Tax=Bdellovibrio sp. SKB1291214 TaxID=1732569 RepID=UPI000B514F92|nr:chemotaxis protein CheA [Bdellovibrio sp. SKB1291214]UYL08688.1 chemotaxis protein CheA [Bdellovibrio sp. SKB1291214]
MSGDNAFFEELQMDFLNESLFMFEQYDESMMKLENSDDPAKDLTDIFRVAHSVKGGAAAVGLSDLAKFAHVAEDLLDLLRSKPELVNSNVISLLLQAGDELKNRISSLQQGKGGPWDPSALVKQLVEVTEGLSGKKSSYTKATEAAAASPQASAPQEEKIAVPDDFFEHVDAAAAACPVEPKAEIPEPAEDVTNHDLLAELLSQLSPEDQAEFHAKEAAENAEKELIKELENAAIEIPEQTAPPVVVAASAVAGPVAGPKVSPAATASPEPVAETPKLKVVSEAKAPAQSEGGGGGGGSKSPAKNLTSTIKVDTGRVDSVLDAVGELVVLKNQLVHDETVRSGENLRLEAIVDQLDKAVRELYEKTLSIRMTPLKSMFIKIQRIVRDVSITLDKPVDLQLIGEETEVERTVFELLGDPLVHLVRNSMDHGVEKKEIRKERGKPEMAKVIVSAKQNGGNVIIDISDDGGGINREKVLNKAMEKGFVPKGVDPATIPDEQVFQYIFYPGFSTADKISDLSGRGVGLDVVKSNLDKIHGKINIISKAGVGSTFRLTIPLSTAITDGIIVSLDGSRFILPIHSIREIVRVLPKDYTHISNAGKVANIRGHLLPVIDVSATLGSLNESFNAKDARRDDTLSARREETMLVIIESVTGQMAFPVDDVLGQAQVVVKPIVTGFDIPEIAGAAILGDGRTVLILEPGSLLQSVSKSSGMVGAA